MPLISPQLNPITGLLSADPLIRKTLSGKNTNSFPNKARIISWLKSPMVGQLRGIITGFEQLLKKTCPAHNNRNNLSLS